MIGCRPAVTGCRGFGRSALPILAHQRGFAVGKWSVRALAKLLTFTCECRYRGLQGQAHDPEQALIDGNGNGFDEWDADDEAWEGSTEASAGHR